MVTGTWNGCAPLVLDKLEFLFTNSVVDERNMHSRPS